MRPLSITPRRHPDILDLSRFAQELMTFALLAVHPIARQAVAISLTIISSRRSRQLINDRTIVFFWLMTK